MSRAASWARLGPPEEAVEAVAVEAVAVEAVAVKAVAVAL